MAYRPPFKISSRLLSQYAEVMKELGFLSSLRAEKPQPKLRRSNLVKSIHGSTAIEGNSLSLKQITALLEGKRVLGPQNEIREIQNAIQAYEAASSQSFHTEANFLKAHGMLMKGLLADAGRYRRGAVGVLTVEKSEHLAPPAKRVPELMEDLFLFLKRDKDTPLFFKAALAHYEIEFIHPFADGNGRIGRLWHHVGLIAVNRIFEFVPFESLVHQRQKQYYEILRRCDRAGDATPFLEWSSELLLGSLQEFRLQHAPRRQLGADRLMQAAEHWGKRGFSRAEYLTLFPGLSTASASRDLAEGVANKLLLRIGTKNQSRYRFA